jgi:FMN phosphatase YigB (HAD superfamily)
MINLKHNYFKIQKFTINIIFPWGSFCLLLLILTPLGEILSISFRTNQLIALCIFFITFLGAKILTSVSKKQEEMNLTFVDQNNARDLAFKKIPKNGSDIKILIYTSYSIFSNLEATFSNYPNLANSRIQILAKDPDIHILVPKGTYSITRRRQLNTALDSIHRHKEKNNNIEIRFYANAPWVRGIKIDENFMIYSTYTDKSKIGKEVEVEYSGTCTPWIAIDNNRLSNPLSTSKLSSLFIERFNNLYNLIWSHCTKYKNLIIDLQGTIYDNKKIDKFFIDQLPNEYIQYIIKKNNLEHNSEDIKNKYQALVNNGLSGTQSILNSLNGYSKNTILLTDYLTWKDSKLDNYSFDIDKNQELCDALTLAKERFNLFVLTNHTAKFTKLLLSSLGVLDCFDEENLITIDKTLIPKPSDKLRTSLVEKYNINLKKSIFIGDRIKVDLSYIKDYSLAAIHLKDYKFLPTLLTDLQYPVEWIKEQSLNEQCYELL